MIITLEEVKSYARIDIDEDDELLQSLIVSAQEYLKNATGKEYLEKDEEGNPISYGLEKVYLQLLVAYWYEKRIPISDGSKFSSNNGVVEDFNFMAKSIMLQLKMK